MGLKNYYPTMLKPPNDFFRPESPSPSLVPQAGTPGSYREPLPIFSTVFSRITSSISTAS